MHVITQAYCLTGIAIVITYLNHRTARLQPTIGVMLAAVLTSLGLIGIGKIFGSGSTASWIKNIAAIDFNAILMNGLLSFLLFAGALSMDIDALKKVKIEVSTLATAGTLLSTVLMGYLTYFALNTLIAWRHLAPSHPIPLAPCLLFGALISPTDPIAVIATLKQMQVPKRIETVLAGESLFNDGVGIVTFLTLYQAILTSSHTTMPHIVHLFFQQSLGGLCYGISLGIVCVSAIRKSVHNPTLPTLLTVGVVTGGYAFSQWLDVSGPLAMVASGIYIAHHCPEKAHRTLYLFWTLLDELLNIVLFFLVGFEMMIIQWDAILLYAMPMAIVLALMVRSASVILPMACIHHFKKQPKNISKILIWGGLRGGLALALALSIPRQYAYQNFILAMTFSVVLFSILVQGTTIGDWMSRWKKHA